MKNKNLFNYNIYNLLLSNESIQVSSFLHLNISQSKELQILF